MSNTHIEPHDDHSLLSATYTADDRTLDVYDDGWGPVWCVASAHGHFVVPWLLVRARTWEDAYEIALDEAPTVDYEDLHYAYGFDEPEELQKALEAAENGEGEWPELTDGYTYQPNASGTGIVETHDQIYSIAPLTSDLMEVHKINIKIGQQ